MSHEQIIESVRASFAFEDMIMSEDDEKRARRILDGEPVDNIIAEIIRQYSTKGEDE